jgi:hypothetical protein
MLPPSPSTTINPTVTGVSPPSRTGSRSRQNCETRVVLSALGMAIIRRRATGAEEDIATILHSDHGTQPGLGVRAASSRCRAAAVDGHDR